MRVALYARVSTERQERQGTIASQLDALHRFAQDQHHEVMSAYVCVDDGYSGSRLDRPGLDRLRDGAEAGAFDAVVVLCPDRLARKYAYQVLILEELERFAVPVIFLDQPPSEDPHARLLVQIQGAIAEYERMKITERYRRGKLFRARQGEVVSWKVPYGYRRIPRRDGVPAQLEIAEPEAQVVRQIFTWHVEERLSIRQIALRLTESAHPSATGLRRWGHSMVGRLLRNEVYIGTLYFNRYESLGGEATTAGPRRRTKSRTRRRPASEWIPIRVPPLISEELFGRSQAIHPDNSRFSPRHLKSGHYLLRGLVRCRVCDLGTVCHRMRGRDGTFHHYYYCTGHDSLRARSLGRCPQRHLRADELDALVWTEVRRHLEHPTLVMEAYATLRAEPGRRPDEVVAQEVRGLEHKLVEMDREEHRLLDAYQAGLIELPQLERRQGLLRQRRGHVQASLETTRGEHITTLRRAELQMSLESFTRSVRAPLATLPFEDRQRLVRTVIERVMVEEGQVDIHFAIPVPDPPNGDGADRQGHVSSDFRLRPHHRRPGRALPGRGSRRCHSAGGSGAGRPVRARGRGARSRGTDHVALATPCRPETPYDRAWRVQRSITLLVPTEPVAEPDPGRCEVPRRVATARAVSTP
jgi:site-specific DNA recombinase